MSVFARDPNAFAGAVRPGHLSARIHARTVRTRPLVQSEGSGLHHEVSGPQIFDGGCQPTELDGGAISCIAPLSRIAPIHCEKVVEMCREVAGK